MKPIFNLILIVAIGSMSCRPSLSTMSSKPKEASSDSAKADTCNLQDMEKKSSEASAANLRCAYDALRTAGKLAGGGVADAISFVEGVNELRSFFGIMSEFYALLADYMRSESSDAASAESTVESTTGLALGAPISSPVVVGGGRNSAVYDCFRKNRGVIVHLYQLHQLATAGNSKDPSDVSGTSVSAPSISGFVDLAFSLTGSVSSMFEAAGRCAEAMEGNRNVDFNRAVVAWKKIMTGVETVRVLASCSYSIGTGGYIIAQNTSCYMEDLKQYHEGREQVDKQREDYIGSEVIQDSYSGPLACMAKYGIHLWKQNFITYATRSYACADHCGNKGSGLGYLKANQAKIFNEKDLNYCSRIVQTARTSDEVNLCLVYCCDQNGSCSDAARAKLNQ